MSNRVQLQSAFVLHHRPYRDSSLLLEMFTRDHGRIGVVARGVRGGKSRRAALLQPFRPLLLSWAGRGELLSLADVEADGPPLMLVGERLMSGFYLNEVLVRLISRHDPHEALFRLYAAALTDLAHGRPAEPVLRLFEKYLLQELGYGLVLDHCVMSGEPVVPGAQYRYQPERGPVSGEAATEGILVSGATLLALEADELSGEGVLPEAKRLMRALLTPHLGSRPLKSRELFRALRPRD